MNTRKIVNIAMVAAVVVAMNSTALAKAPEMEKCYGIAKAGKNDCATKGGNACAAQVKQDRDPNAWIFVPKGTCAKIVGGSLANPNNNTESKNS